MAGKKAPQNSAPKLRFTVNHALADLYVLLLFTLFPLYLSNYYTAARRDKFWVFVILTAVVGISVAAVALTTYLSRNNAYNRKLNTYHDPLKFNITDYGFAAFLLISIISTFASGNIAHCFMGLSGTKSNGRNMGLLMILMMFVCYVIISRYFFSKKFVFYGIFIGITIVSFVAIVNYYYWDILGIFAKYQSNDNVQQNFTSTIGNKNYLSALICVALPFSLGMAITTKDLAMRIVAYVSTGIQFMGLLVATSDGGFLGCFAAIAAILILSSRELKKLMRFCLCLGIMMLSSKILYLAEILSKKGSKGYSSFSDFFVNNNAVYAIAAVAFVAFGVLYFIQNKKRNIAVCILLSFLTFGLFHIVWMYSLVRDTRSIQKKTGSGIGEMLCIIFIPFYSLYWWYTRGEIVKQKFNEHNYRAIGNGLIYLILAFLGLNIVSLAIMQHNFNSFNSKLYPDQNASNRETEIKIHKCVFWIFLGLVCLAVLIFAGLFINYTFIDTESKLKGMKRFFRFNEMWGTHRGYFWIKSFEIFGEMSFGEKLIGAGPENFYFKFVPYFSEMLTLFAESSTNSAHNVYVNYLITHGILGVGAYLTFIGSAIYFAFKRSKDNPLSFVCVGVILAYAVQDIVNIANPVNTPWLIAFIALSESTALRANNSNMLADTDF